MGVDHKPHFNCWVLCALKKHDAIIALSKMHHVRYCKHMHKFSVKCPKLVKDVLELDKHNGNIMWANAIAKE